jgi:hypothetical protein
MLTIHKYDQSDQTKENKMDEIFTNKWRDKKCISTTFGRENWKKPLVTTKHNIHSRIISNLITKN